VLDPETGTFRFDGAAVEISPALRRTGFLMSSIGQAAAVWVQNEPFCSWALPEVSDGPYRFRIIVFFNGERLAEVDIADSRPEFGSSWSDWAEQKERARKASHDEWLRNHLGKRRSFLWGRVDSVLDTKSGGAVIITTYA
jgi:hypothetical protein